jgi:ABC-type nitrate/sulfonate/bicarbonate transport system permease component
MTRTIGIAPSALSRIAEAVAPWAAVVALVAVWEVVSRSGLVTRFTLPAFSIVMERIVDDFGSGDLVRTLTTTVGRAVIGFLIAIVLGIAVGIAMVRSRTGAWFFSPLISFGFPMPKIAFVPIVVLWLGFHDGTKITMIVIDTMFPIITATVAGLNAADMQLTWAARNMGATDREVLRHVLIPTALPQILTGLQVALPIAIIVAIIMEMMTGGSGLGAAMVAASRQADSVGVFAGLVEISVVGVGLIRLLGFIRQRFLAWHPETKALSVV